MLYSIHTSHSICRPHLNTENPWVILVSKTHLLCLHNGYPNSPNSLISKTSNFQFS